MRQQFLIERYDPSEVNLVESRDAQKNLYLAGRMMAAEQKNLNQRVYPRHEIEKAVQLINERAKEGMYIAGELNHPDNLSIDLKNVSHIITEAWMDGNNAMGKCRVLNTPSGQIVKALIEGGMKLGVSSRGTGNVTNEGIVEDFQFVTIDIVAQPSGPGCYPDVVTEALGYKPIVTLAEAVVHDEQAQRYLAQEVKRFINELTRRR